MADPRCDEIERTAAGAERRPHERGIHRADGEHTGETRRHADLTTVVAGRGDHEQALAARVGDCVGQHRRGLAAAEAEVDDAGRVIGSPDDARGDIDVAAGAVGREHLDRQDGGLRRHARLGNAVALGLGHRARDVRAVPVVVRGVVRALDDVPARQQAPRQIGRGRHSRVDHGDDDTRAARQRPGRPGPDGVEAPLPVAVRRLEDVQAAERLHVAQCPRAPQRSQRGAPMGGGQAHDDGPQAWHRADLHRVGGIERRCGQRTRPQADHHRVARPRGSRHQQDGEDGGEDVRRHGRSVAGWMVTAPAWPVPDV